MAKAGKEIMNKHCNDSNAKHFKVVDAETGIKVHDVIWANDETGEYDQLRKDENGKLVLNEAGDGIAIDRKTGKIKFVDVRQQT